MLSLTEPLKDYPELLLYARGMSRYARGDEAGALTYLKDFTNRSNNNVVEGTALELPGLQPNSTESTLSSQSQWQIYVAFGVCSLMLLLSSGYLLFSSAKLAAESLRRNQILEVPHGKRLATYVKPSVVRILDGCSGNYTATVSGVTLTDRFHIVSSGSGFFVHPDGYIATNAQVVDKAYQSTQNTQRCKDSLTQNAIDEFASTFKERAVGSSLTNSVEIREEISQSILEQDLELHNLVFLPNGDSFPYDIKSFGNPISESGILRGKDVAIVKIEINNAPSLILGESDTVNQLDSVVQFGYPAVAGFNSLDFYTIYEVTATGGDVSATTKPTRDGISMLQISAPIASGSAGGPVINENFEVVGMSTFGNLSANQTGTGFSFAIRTNTIREFLGETGVRNLGSEVDDLYRKGLELFWKGDYRRAMLRFEEVQRLFPPHSEVERFIQESQQAMSSRPADRSLTYSSLATTIVAAGIMLTLVRRSSLKHKANYLLEKALTTKPGLASLPFHWRLATANSIHLLVGLEFEKSDIRIGSLSPYLQLSNSKEETLYFELLKNTHRVGRDPEWSDLTITKSGWEIIPQKGISLVKEGKSYRIFDSDRISRSTASIRVNSTEIDSQVGHLLENGDRLTIGEELPALKVTAIYYSPSV